MEAWLAVGTLAAGATLLGLLALALEFSKDTIVVLVVLETKRMNHDVVVGEGEDNIDDDVVALARPSILAGEDTEEHACTAEEVLDNYTIARDVDVQTDFESGQAQDSWIDGGKKAKFVESSRCGSATHCFELKENGGSKSSTWRTIYIDVGKEYSKVNVTFSYNADKFDADDDYLNLECKTGGEWKFVKSFSNDNNSLKTVTVSILPVVCGAGSSFSSDFGLRFRSVADKREKAYIDDVLVEGLV